MLYFSKMMTMMMFAVKKIMVLVITMLLLQIIGLWDGTTCILDEEPTFFPHIRRLGLDSYYQLCKLCIAVLSLTQVLQM